MLLTSFSENIYKKIFYRFLMKTLIFREYTFAKFLMKNYDSSPLSKDRITWLNNTDLLSRLWKIRVS